MRSAIFQIVGKIKTNIENVYCAYTWIEDVKKEDKYYKIATEKLTFSGKSAGESSYLPPEGNQQLTAFFRWKRRQMVIRDNFLYQRAKKDGKSLARRGKRVSWFLTPSLDFPDLMQLALKTVHLEQGVRDIPVYRELDLGKGNIHPPGGEYKLIVVGDYLYKNEIRGRGNKDAFLRWYRNEGIYIKVMLESCYEFTHNNCYAVHWPLKNEFYCVGPNFEAAFEVLSSFREMIKQHRQFRSTELPSSRAVFSPPC